MSPRPTVLVISSGDETYRGYCLEQVAAAYDVVLVTATEPTWERPFVTDHEVADPGDEQALLTAGRALAGRHRLAGVVTWDEWHLVASARLAEQLGLATNTTEAVRACRDKATARTLFARQRVPSAASVAAHTLSEAASAAESIGYPVVLKPAGLAASIGVIRVDRAEELPDGFAFATAGTDRGRESAAVLVEEYLDGPEISVECVTHQGHTTAVAVTRKTLGHEPYFEEIAHSVDAADPLLSEVAAVAASAVRALGITSGVSHVEMRLTGSGPRLVEVNARIAGDMIGHLVRLATGIDLPRAAADLACGRAPDLTLSRSQAAAIRLLYPPASGTLTARHLTPGFAECTPWLRQVHWQREIGDTVKLPPDGDMFAARVGFLITTAPTAALARQRVAEACDQLTIRIEPDDRPAPDESAAA